MIVGNSLEICTSRANPRQRDYGTMNDSREFPIPGYALVKRTLANRLVGEPADFTTILLLVGIHSSQLPVHSLGSIGQVADV